MFDFHKMNEVFQNIQLDKDEPTDLGRCQNTGLTSCSREPEDPWIRQTHWESVGKIVLGSLSHVCHGRGRNRDTALGGEAYEADGMWIDCVTQIN